MVSLFFFIALTIIVFFILLFFVFPRLLYIGALLYHVFKTRKKEPKKRFTHYKLKDLKEVKSEKIR